MELTGQQPGVVVTYPWTGTEWEAAAAAANRGMNGQGYIVHAVMMASRVGRYLAPVAVLLAALQATAAVVYLLTTFKLITP
jgi:hypothetical protein